MHCIKDLSEIFTLTQILSCSDIKLCAWTKKASENVIVLYTGSRDFIYHNLDVTNPILKQIPWFTDALHDPVAIDFSPCGNFLLVLTQLCHLYIIPVCALSDTVVHNSLALDIDDLTIHVYPFQSKGQKYKDKWKARKSNSNIACSTTPNEQTEHQMLQEEFNSGFMLTSECPLSENEIKLKEILLMKHKIFPSALCWWQTQSTSQEIGIIGTKSGTMIFVDLISGVKIGETSVAGEIRSLIICYADIDYTFLLINLNNGEQYRLTLEQKQTLFIAPGKMLSKEELQTPAEMATLPTGSGYTTSSRMRLQGLKQMSVGKLASLRHKIAETRSKITTKQGVSEESSCKIGSTSPENVGPLIGETRLSCQVSGEEKVLAGYYAPSQLLTIHSTNLELVPRSVHKMPKKTQEILLCDRIIYVVSEDRQSVQAVSSILTETQIDQPSDFNSDSLLGKWSFDKESQILNEKSEGANQQEGKFDQDELVLCIHKMIPREKGCDISQMYNIENAQKELLRAPRIENCVVVTNKNVYIIHLKDNILKVALDLILETHEVEKAEQICNIFGINIQKLLESAGDIKLKDSEFPTAIALYKLSKCGALKSIVKLACASHCFQVLNYSLMLMSNSASEMTLTEKIHLSNLIIMAYTQQILKAENNRKLLEKFMEFLQKNTYFDEVLAVNVTGQSLLFTCLYELITRRGLILDGYSVLIKLMERFTNSRALEWNLNKNEFWTCATEASLIEAIVVKVRSFSIYANFVSEHLEDLDLGHLNRLLALLDPTSPYIRSLALTFQNSDGCLYENEENQTIFPFGKLSELFLLALLVKLQKENNDRTNYESKFILPQKFESQDESAAQQNEYSECLDAFSDEIWPIRKSARAAANKCFNRRPNAVLSCGYGHSALIRNGSVYTWGQTVKGCLGQGPTMNRYSAPAPVSWLNSFRIEVSLVSCGKNHTAVLTNNGVYTWGCSKYGQLGLGQVQKSPYPRLVSALCNETVITVSCGQFHTLAVNSQGSVFSWGWGVHGQLGNGTIEDQREPKYLTSLKDHVIVDVAAGHGHSLVLTEKGRVYAFGSGVFGQLGTGTTMKFSLPTLVKGFDGKVVAVATGYFHNLALTESNSLYTWGMSPQCLRFQAQARKKSKLSQNQILTSPSTELGTAKSPSEESLQRIPNGPADECAAFDKTQSEVHLSPSLVDKSNIEGKITQLSCGCHHSALVTDSGGLYTWGRSIDGQLGAGEQRQLQIPTQINEKHFKVDCVSCGCEFTTAQEKRTGKIYAWGNNAVGQLAFPVKESATKSLDGKLVMLKSCKRIVRLLDRNAGLNSVDVPKEITDIPPPTFTYHPLNKHMYRNFKNLSVFDPAYSQASLHFVLENFSRCINLNFIFSKSLEYGNLQAASKIALLQNNHKLSMVYQLKALQSVGKYKAQSASYVGQQEDANDSATSAGLSQTEDHIQDLKLEYIKQAKVILETYLGLEFGEDGEKSNKLPLLETGVQFWMAEKLPIRFLEEFFLDKLDDIFYELAFLLFCQQRDGQMAFLEQFTTDFLLTLASKILHVLKDNKSCIEYQRAMSKILVGDKMRENKNLRKKFKSDSYLEAIEENLKDQWMNENHIRIACADVTSENVYFFSCGHYFSPQGLKEKLLVFHDVNDQRLTSNFTGAYEDLMSSKGADLACPSCVRNYFG